METKAPALPGLTARTTLRRLKRDAYSDSTQRLQPTRRNATPTQLNATLTSVQLTEPPIRIHCDCPQSAQAARGTALTGAVPAPCYGLLPFEASCQP